jgi:hypothetical protein
VRINASARSSPALSAICGRGRLQLTTRHHRATPVIVAHHATIRGVLAASSSKWQSKVPLKIIRLLMLSTKFLNRYREAVFALQGHTFPVIQCILPRQQIRLREAIPRTNLRWEHVTASGLIWFESTGANYDTYGYLVAPYIWLWMLAIREGDPRSLGPGF